ncbi:MAG: PKD domain-containing protein, partial [Algicola sp.]|nr:PKD domain-containing protein [Algicola sp.]
MSYKNHKNLGVIFFLLISSALAFSITLKSEIILFAPPVVDFTFNNNACSGQSVSFNSTVTGDGPFEYNWNFGDGSSSTQANPNHVFTTLGCGTQNFNVTLVVTDDNGETSSLSQTVTILQAPNIDFTDENALPFEEPFENCNSTSIAYTIEVGNNSSSNGCISSYAINWGDGNIENNVSFPISHTYLTLGSFNMVITAIGNNGCQAQKTYLVANSSNPTGGIVSPGSTVNLCTPIAPLQFAISNWGENPPDAIYNINYGDGTTMTLTQNQLEASTFYNNVNPAASDDYPIPHEYTESNCPDSNYTVFLDIITSCGESNFTAGPITILERPEVSFDADDIACQNLNIAINNTSSTGYNPGCTTGAAWFWDMGDGTTYTDFEPNHAYTSPGVYTISLYAENYCGETDPVFQDICIEAPLSPTFTSNSNEDCAPFNIVLSNTTDLLDQCDVPTYEWIINYTSEFCGTSSDFNFINGTNANSVNPEITFINPGIYEIILEATNSCGTTSSAPTEISIKAPPQVTLGEIDDFCASDSVINPTATVESCGPNSPTYNWSLNIGSSPVDWEFINGTTSNSEFPEIEFYTPNTYVLSLEVSNACGSNIDTEEFIFSPVPEITNTDLTQTICSGTSIEEIVLQSDNPNTTYELTGTSPTGNVTGILPPGTVTTIPAHILTLNSGTTGTVVYTVTPFLVDSCPGEPVEFTITVNEGPSIATQPLSGTYCIDGNSEVLAFTLGGNATGTINYQWYVNDNGSNDPTDPNTTAIPSPEGQQEDYQPPTDTLGTLYYFCVISFSGSGSCSEITTIPAEIIVTPNVVVSNETPLTQIICSGATAEELSFSINDGGAGAITYNWYSSDDNVIDASDTPVGTNSNTFDPGILNTSGFYYYYVTIDVDESLGCSDVSSLVFVVEVVEDPTVIITPDNQSICTNVSADLLVAQVSGGIDINNDGIIDNADYDFQWFLNGNPVTETNNADADESTFDHDNTLPAGIYDYYCVVSQPNNLDCNGTSNTVTITVNEGPSIATQPLSGTYCIDGNSEVLAFTLGGNATGTINYQWYVNDNGSNDPTDPNTTAIPSPEGQQEDYQPPTDTLGTLYYFCVISFSGSGSCSEITTIPAEIIVTPNVVVSNETPLTQIICSGATAEELSFSINDGGAGAITYNWYSSDDNVIDASDTPVGTNSNTFDPGILNTSGFYYYYVTIDVDESLGCSDVSSLVFVVEVVEDPTVIITPDNQSICTNVSADLLVAQVSGGIDINNDGIIDNADYDFQWFLNGNPVTETNNADADESTFDHDNTLPAGIYDYYCVVSQPNNLDCNGTSNTVTITV